MARFNRLLRTRRVARLRLSLVWDGSRSKSFAIIDDVWRYKGRECCPAMSAAVDAVHFGEVAQLRLDRWADWGEGWMAQRSDPSVREATYF